MASARIDFAKCTEGELWRFVACHLEAGGIQVVLVGGAVVAILSGGAYRSGDLDFVRLGLGGEEPDRTMSAIGFHRQGRHFVHPECGHLFVEFVSGPLGIGENRAVVPEVVEVDGVLLRRLSPTDCVCDRLASYIHFRARECLDQAALVARAHRVDWRRIRRWCKNEGPGGMGAYADLRRVAVRR